MDGQGRVKIRCSYVILRSYAQVDGRGVEVASSVILQARAVGTTAYPQDNMDMMMWAMYSRQALVRTQTSSAPARLLSLFLHKRLSSGRGWE